ADQTDQDSLPAYEVLDEIVHMYMERNLPVERIVAAGLPRDAVEQVVRLVRISEYKRRQSPVGVRVTDRAFGRDWRYPITSGFRELGEAAHQRPSAGPPSRRGTGAGLKDLKGECDEENHGGDQAVQARRGARGARRRRHHRPRGDRGQGLRPPEGPYRALP